MDLSQRLRDIRKEKNMTQQELAEKSGKALATIIRYESGQLDTLFQKDIGVLADSLSVTIPYFFGFSDNEDAFPINIPVMAINDFGDLEFDHEYYTFRGDPDTDEFIFVITNDNYLPLWPKKTECFIDRADIYYENDYLLVYLKATKQFVVRVYHVEKRHIILLPIPYTGNPVEKLVFKSDEYDILGKVTEVRYKM